MLTKLILAFVLSCCSLQQSTSQDIFEVRINCTFEIYGQLEFYDYTCLASNLIFDFSNPFYYIVIDGQHLPGYTNINVTQLTISDSETSSIPANIFQVFPNLELIVGMRSGITSITPPNFTFARRLRGLFLTYNNLPILFASPFTTQGATITHLILFMNQVQAVGNGFFNGLVNLEYLNLGGNSIQVITPQMFAPLVNLREFLAPMNSIETLHPRLFERNLNIEIIGLELNNINAVGPNIFNDLSRLQTINFNGNRCINQTFNLTETPIAVVNETLRECFANSPPEPPRTRTLLFELRGNMSMFDEYNEQILNVLGRAW